MASIGDEVIGGPNEGEVNIHLFVDIVLPSWWSSQNYYFTHLSVLPKLFEDSAIFAPTLDVVDEVNQFMISLHFSQLGEIIWVLIAYWTLMEHQMVLLKYIWLNLWLLLIINCCWKLVHLWCYWHSNGLCNVTRLIITRLCDYVLEAEVLGGYNQWRIQKFPTGGANCFHINTSVVYKTYLILKHNLILKLNNVNTY